MPRGHAFRPGRYRRRGHCLWSNNDIQTALSGGPVGTTTDNRSAAKTPDGQPRNDTASVYGGKNGYIVVNDRTGEVVQVSGKNDPSWIPDSRIKWK
ncbi:colicin E5-related ribonuclease [Paraburkholderia phymatum]|uniref:Colicin E5-related ribonuclease n=1 Tax=Paraburkholderia phymatum TaxID=148447 RepID=A0ACC6U450_9BURK